MSRVSLASAAAFGLGALVVPFFATAQTTTTYGYDGQGQVKSVTRPAQTVTYDYDAAANRTAIGASSEMAARSAQATSAKPPISPEAQASQAESLQTIVNAARAASYLRDQPFTPPDGASALSPGKP